MAEQTIREKVAEEVKQGFQTAVTTVSSHTSDILGGTLGGLVDDFKNVSKSMLGVLGSGLGGIFNMFSVEERQLDEQKRQTGLLKGLLNYFKREQKEELRQPDGSTNIIGTPGAIMEAILVFVGALAFGLGGMVGAILKPFQVLVKGLRLLFPVAKWLGTVLSGIFTVIKSLPAMKGLVNVFSTIGKAISAISSPVLQFIKSTRLFSTIVKGFTRGFSKLAWPITAIFAVIDFFKAFFGTEGKLVDRIRAGLVGVVKGFLDLPVKLLGWISDWVLGIFGIEIEGGSAKKIMAGIEWTVNASIKTIVGVFQGITAPIKWVIDSIKWISGKIGSLVKFLISPLQSIVSGYWSIIGNIKDKIKSMFSGVVSWVENIDVTEIPSMIFRGITNLVKNIIPNIFSGLFNRAKEALSNIGEMNIPIISPIANIGSKIGNFVSGMAGKVKDKIFGMGDIPIDTSAMSKAEIQSIMDRNLSTMVGNLGNTLSKIKDMDIPIISDIASITKNIGTSISNIAGNIKDKFLELKDTPIKIDFGEIANRIGDAVSNITSKIKGKISSIFSNIPDVWDTITKYWDTTKKKFASLIEKLNPLEWFKLDEIKIDGPLEKALEMIMNIGEKIKSFIVSTIKEIINKIPKILLPKSVEKWSGNEMDRVFEEKPTRIYRKAVTNSPIGDMEKEGKRREVEAKAKEKRDNKKLQEQDRKMIKEMQRSQQTSNNQWQSVMNQYVSANQEKGRPSETEAPDQIEHFGLIYMNTPTMGTSH